MRQPTIAALAAATLVVVTAACGGDDDTTAVTATAVSATTPAPGAADTAPATVPGTAPDSVPDAAPDSALDADRCAANRAAGTITYLSGFDFAATASIIEVVLADQRGYFDALCLDVELQPSFSTANYPIVASGDAQFASAGSFSEVVRYAAANDADLVAVSIAGRTVIDSLILKPGSAETLADLAGTTIGVKGALPPSVAAMLATAGLREGADYETVLLDGFDPLAHIALDGIVGFPGYKSNEPGTLERTGVEFDLFDPADYDVPGSFGVLFTNRAFIDDHPTAAQDFLRAAMRGMADALADPAGAAETAVALVEANGNPSFLSAEGEMFRWATDAELIQRETPAGTGVGVPDIKLLRAEVAAYAAVGLFDGAAPPDIGDRVDADLLAGVYDDSGAVVWDP